MKSAFILFLFIFAYLSFARFLTTHKFKTHSICDGGHRLDPIFGYKEFIDNCIMKSQSPRFQSLETSTCPSDCPNYRDATLNIAAEKAGWRDFAALSDSAVQGSFDSEVDEIPNYRGLYDATTNVFGSAIKRVRSLHALVEAIKAVSAHRVNGDCIRIRFLSIHSHGSPGYIGFPSGGISVVHNGILATSQLSCAFAPNAYIAITGCNVAAGCQGDDLLMYLAATLLKTNGGKLKAFTSYGLALGGLTFGLVGSISVNLDNQYLTVDSGPANARWDNAPRTGTYCAGELTAWKTKISEVLGKLRNCRGKTEEMPSTLRPHLESKITELEQLETAMTTFIGEERARTTRVGFSEDDMANKHNYLYYFHTGNNLMKSDWADVDCD